MKSILHTKPNDAYDIGMRGMADYTKLGQEVDYFLLAGIALNQPFYSNTLAPRKQSFVHFGMPPFAYQITFPQNTTKLKFITFINIQSKAYPTDD
jgi:hypothetical protein